MRSPLGALLSGIRNASPVPLSPRHADTVRIPWLTGANSNEKYLAAYGAVGTLFAIVNRTANSTAGVGWHLWRKAASGKDEDRTEVSTHAALTVWDNPNPFMDRQEFVETAQQHIDLTGESIWIVGRNPRADLPLELWPVRPDRVEPVPHPTKFLAGWIYCSPDGEQIPLKLNEVIQIKMPNPSDPFRGLGPVQSILTDLDSTKYSAEWNRNFFLNSAEPGGIIQVEKRLSDDEFDEMAARWNEQHRGVSKAHRVAIIEQGEWVDRKYTMREMQFAELRTVSREIIREAFGFPKPMLGSVDDVNRANAEAGEVMFARWLVKPRADRIKGVLNRKLLPLFGSTTKGIEFDFDNPVPDDRAANNEQLAAQATAAVALVNAGFDAAEVLEAVGLPEMAWKERITVVAAPPPGKDAPPAEKAKPARAAIDIDPENAQKWEAVEHLDDSTCEPCRAAHGRTYRNREEAYKDYPGGSGYKNCVGAEHGNDCRGYVRKRKASN